MRAIFLDIDGVLNSKKFHSGPGPMESLRISGFKHGDEFRLIQKLDGDAVRLLYAFVVQHDLKIVFSTNWRLVVSEKLLKKMLCVFAPFTDCMFAGSTPELDFGTKRGHEIYAWLSKNAVSQFVIFDDLEHEEFTAHQRPYFVKTDFNDGLQQKHIDRAKLILECSK